MARPRPGRRPPLRRWVEVGEAWGGQAERAGRARISPSSRLWQTQREKWTFPAEGRLLELRKLWEPERVAADSQFSFPSPRPGWIGLRGRTEAGGVLGREQVWGWDILGEATREGQPSSDGWWSPRTSERAAGSWAGRGSAMRLPRPLGWAWGAGGRGRGMAQEGAEICPRWTGHRDMKVSQTTGRSWQLHRISENSLHGNLLTRRLGLSRQRAQLYY